METLSQSIQAPIAHRQARIEIIPLIDVIFFLLATFVLFTLTLSRIQSVPVDLPQASAQRLSGDEDDQVIVQVTGDAQAYWDGELVALAAIPSKLAAYKLAVPAPKLLVTGDSSAHYGEVIEVLDQARAAGITLVSLETAPRATGH